MKILSLLALAAAVSVSAAEPLTLPLWPEGAPGQMLPRSEATDAFIKKHQSKNTVTDIAEPTITVYRPEKPNGTSVIVAPGGGFMFLSAVHEGTQVCEWLNTLGVTGVLLKYRTPTRDEPAAHEKPVQDAQQALKLIHVHAAEWQLNPKRVGLLGFSAGGNLLAHLACDRGPTKTELPDFGVMIYGGGFLDPKDPSRLDPSFNVPADAPPMFIACAHDDKTNPIAATLLYLEYKKQNIPAELHLFTHGGHGFGMRDNKQPINQWPARCEEWMDSMGWLPTMEKLDAAIFKRDHELKKIIASMRLGGSAGFICGNEMAKVDQLKEVELELTQAKAQGNNIKMVALETEARPLRVSVKALQEELSRPRIKIEDLTTRILQLKTELAVLQAQRENLLMLNRN